MKRALIKSGHARTEPSRRHVLRGALASVATLSLTGCDRLSRQAGFVDVLKSAEDLSHAAHQLVTGRNALAQEFDKADISAHFRPNGTLLPRDADYRALMANGFKGWRLKVGGLVEDSREYSLAELRALPARTQITRHDCVEGWSSIGQWKGVQLARVLEQVKPLARAKYVLLRCADSMEGPTRDGRDSRYYESIGLDEAYHPQTLLAYELNGEVLPVAHGAPLRLRVERQLGYKHAKFLMSIELVESFAAVRGGQGGYWEDNGYEWYAGV
jgi:DMSO/TMAO reductase YedYZ molybdopterin-dependent catalytic subunit